MYEEPIKQGGGASPAQKAARKGGGKEVDKEMSQKKLKIPGIKCEVTEDWVLGAIETALDIFERGHDIILTKRIITLKEEESDGSEDRPVEKEVSPEKPT